MTIPVELLQSCSDALEAFRDSGDIIFDGRDHGNYLSYSWKNHFDMLMGNDPTGLAAGMVLDEMFEATIVGATVKLSRVLREPGYLQRLQAILDVRQELLDAVHAPRLALMTRVDEALAQTCADLGRCSSREVAICLRDAIYSMDRGLKLRWLQFDPGAPAQAHVPLCASVTHHTDIAGFVAALRGPLPFGAHLARIGKRYTAIGIKQPGRIAYLSSLVLEIHGISESRAHDSHMAEALDLGTPTQRYPEWTSQPSTNRSLALQSEGVVIIDQIAKLPRDRLIWLAMVTEIVAQRMADTRPEDVELSEGLLLAMNRPPASDRQLPMVITPNWRVQELTIEGALAELQLTSWELGFLRPALEHYSVETFLPLGESDLALDVSDGRIRPYASDASDFRGNEYKERNARIAAMPPGWAGTRAETEAIRHKLLLRNLADYLLAWGNERFRAEWDKAKPWIERQFKAAQPEALLAGCVRFEPPGMLTHNKIHLYTQSPRHTGFNPRCFFYGRKKEVTHVAHFQPRHSADLVEMLGLAGEQELPEFLRGWRRQTNWTTDTATANWDKTPASTTRRWVFTREILVEGAVSLNVASVPAAVVECIQRDTALALPA